MPWTYKGGCPGTFKGDALDLSRGMPWTHRDVCPGPIERDALDLSRGDPGPMKDRNALELLRGGQMDIWWADSLDLWRGDSLDLSRGCLPLAYRGEVALDI
ncbi:hypothetical protein DPMN_168346 [Dreissena polymorpha]|uniref:Uncharacterized protein n=1 Tax=Dreissena polymorpha TaxID=45954 RepID=A0A9D4F4Y7_DREPO|nr:hypothetical protein DPMN_168346 [Dreissena polymorpha]